MNEQAIKASSPAIHHRARSTRRIGYNGRQPNFCDASILDDLPLEWLRIIIGEKENLVWAQHRHTRTKSSKPRYRAFNSENMRDSHPVEGTILSAFWCVQVRIEVNVNEPNTLSPTKPSGYRPESNCTVPAQNKRCGTLSECSGNAVCGGSGDHYYFICVHGA
jgi:hypothetical protein